MNKIKTRLELSKIEDNIIDVITFAGELTTSDLQGMIMAQILNAYNLGKKSK